MASIKSLFQRCREIFVYIWCNEEHTGGGDPDLEVDEKFFSEEVCEKFREDGYYELFLVWYAFTS